MKSISPLIVKFSAILGLLGIPACSYHKPLPPGPCGEDPRRELAECVRRKPELAVMFVGNSYTFGVPKAFSKLSAARGKKVRVGHSAHGGWTLARHAGHDATLRKIREGRWDVVVFQEQSEIPALSPGRRAAAMFPPLRELTTEARQEGAIPVLYQTWGRRYGDKRRKHDDFHAMTSRVRAGYQAAATNAGRLAVVPVGDFWEREVSAGRGEALFMPDGSHPTERGNQLTAEAFYETIFGK